VTNRKEKRIAALVPNVLGFSPGQRVRIELWARELKAAGWSIEFFPFEDEALHEVLYSGGNTLEKAIGLFRCYKNQLELVMRRLPADIVFIYREAALIGPAILERVAARKGVPVIFDIDDPVFLPYKSPANSWASLLKLSTKTHTLFRLSSQVIAINNLIGDYARQYNPNVTVIPNCIDTRRYVPRPDINDSGNGRPPKLVWIGSQSTMQNLLEIADPLRRIQNDYEAPVLVIGSGKADLGLTQIEARQWSAETEISDLQEGDIGLLPVNDLPWNNWKFFFKAIQYMAIGIPVVARRMGSNSEIIEDGVNGFLVETDGQWYEKLGLLIRDPGLRRRMGAAARRTIEDRFSFERQIPRVLELFENTLDRAELQRPEPSI
jgi:glycosyltransferase involved in cell wall biosynthesis